MISNNQVITKSDLQTMNATALATLASCNLSEPVQIDRIFTFYNVINTTIAAETTVNAFVDSEYIIRELSLSVATGAPSSGVVTATIDTGFLIEPITFSLTYSTLGSVKTARYYGVHQTSTKLSTDPFPNLHPLQVLFKNAPLTITVSNTGTTPSSKIDLCLVLESRLERF